MTSSTTACGAQATAAGGCRGVGLATMLARSGSTGGWTRTEKPIGRPRYSCSSTNAPPPVVVEAVTDAAVPTEEDEDDEEDDEEEEVMAEAEAEDEEIAVDAGIVCVVAEAWCLAAR
jgi:hypothetical protein